MTTTTHHGPPVAAPEHQPAGFSATVETITPDTAGWWLANNSHPDNRRIRKGKVEEYARLMEADRWALNGEGIQFGTDGVLLNGHHRLSAIVLSNTPVPMLVVRGVDREAMPTFDGGTKRNAADVLGLLQSGGLSAKVTASAARLAMWFPAGRRNHSNVEIADFVAANPSLVEACDECMPYTRIVGATPSVVAYGYWRLRAVDPDDCEEFFRRLLHGDNLAAGNPILALRNAYINKAGKPRGVGDGWSDRHEKLAELFHAWNAWRAGRQLTLIKPGRTDNGRGRIIIPEPK